MFLGSLQCVQPFEYGGCNEEDEEKIVNRKPIFQRVHHRMRVLNEAVVKPEEVFAIFRVLDNQFLSEIDVVDDVT